MSIKNVLLKQKGSIQKQNKAKYCKIINQKLVKEESVKNVNAKVSGINTVSVKQNIVKGINPN